MRKIEKLESYSNVVMIDVADATNYKVKIREIRGDRVDDSLKKSHKKYRQLRKNRHNY